MASLSRTLNMSWIGILLLTLIAFISLIVSIIQKDVKFFEGDAWENQGGCVTIVRAYTVAIWTMIVSLTVASYGFWRDSLSNNRKKTFDIVFSGGASASGSLAFVCFILFFFFHNIREDFDIGDRASLSFGISCFFLAVLYFTLDVITVRNGGRSSKNPAVDSSTLI
jgi:hypothetical protein